MAQKRGTMEIAFEILKLAINGTGITAIVYGANLNFNIAKTHIDRLKVKGLIEIENLNGPTRTKLFSTTDRGLDFIDAMATAKFLWDELEIGSDEG